MGKKEERTVWPTPVLQHTQFTPTPPPSSGRYMYIEDVSLSFAANGWRIKDQLIWLPKRKAFVCVCSDQKLGKFSFHCRDVRVRSFRLFGYLCGVGKIDTEKKGVLCDDVFVVVVACFCMSPFIKVSYFKT